MTFLSVHSARFEWGIESICGTRDGKFGGDCAETVANPCGQQVPDVVEAEAQAWPHDDEIDEGMKATLDFPNGAVGTVLCSYAGDGAQPSWILSLSSL